MHLPLSRIRYLALFVPVWKGRLSGKSAGSWCLRSTTAISTSSGHGCACSWSTTARCSSRSCARWWRKRPASMSSVSHRRGARPSTSSRGSPSSLSYSIKQCPRWTVSRLRGIGIDQTRTGLWDGRRAAGIWPAFARLGMFRSGRAVAGLRRPQGRVTASLLGWASVPYLTLTFAGLSRRLGRRDHGFTGARLCTKVVGSPGRIHV
jgi:hypothetical protein